MSLWKSSWLSSVFRVFRTTPFGWTSLLYNVHFNMHIVTNSWKGTMCFLSSPLKQWQCVQPLLEHLQPFYRVEYNFISFLPEIPLSQSQNEYYQLFILSITKYNGNNLYCYCLASCISQTHHMFCKIRTFMCNLGCQTDVIITSNRYRARV